jgi:cytochrome c biogenesis protein CcmG/thiol:disulfide interchange protein DsbE
VLAVVAVLAIGISQLGGSGVGGSAKSVGGSGAAAQRPAANVPAAIASLQRDACKLLPGGPAAFKARLAALRGHPVVVNKWASWCGPCRGEFPIFQRTARQLGGRVAFVGVDSNDNNGSAARFLRQFPVPYPSYADPSNTVAQVFNGVLAFPTTVFYDTRGKLAYIHQGQYQSPAKLAADIRRYATG